MERLRPILVGQRVESGTPVDRRHADEDVEASEPLRRSVDQPLHCRRLPEIRLRDGCRTPGAPHPFGRLLCLVPGSVVGEGDVRAAASEPLGDRRADASTPVISATLSVRSMGPPEGNRRSEPPCCTNAPRGLLAAARAGGQPAPSSGTRGGGRRACGAGPITSPPVACAADAPRRVAESRRAGTRPSATREDGSSRSGCRPSAT